MHDWRARWLALAQDPEFRRGAHDMVGVALGIGAWGLVTGVAMVKSLGVGLALFMSLLVFAGTAQLASLPLIAAGAPIWLVWATAACVNLRFVIFSAQWRPYFVHLPRRQRMFIAYFCADLNFALFLRRFPQPKPAPEQVPYFWGGLVVNGGAWHLASLVGIAAAHSVPTQWGLSFAGTLALVGFIYSLLSDRYTWLAAAVAGCASVAAFALPLKLNIVVAIAAAVAVGVLLDHLRDVPPAPAA
jgi:predicted branched-subunit amino acid permease